MNKSEFIEKLDMMGIECVVLDDNLINPNEIIIFTNKKKCFQQMMKENNLPRMVQDGERKCCIRVISYKEANIAQWEKELKKEGEKKGNIVTIVSREDSNALFLYYAFTSVQISHWLYYNILHILKQRMGCSDKEELAKWLALYIKKKGYRIIVRKIVELPMALRGDLTLLQKCTIRGYQILLKGIRKITVKALIAKSSLHRIFTQKSYFEYLKKTSGVGECWSVINKNVFCSSGSILVRDLQENQAYFVKGNELSAYRGIENEITIQRILKKASGKEYGLWYLPMLDYDPQFRWIRYEFVTWKLLAQYLQEKQLSKREITLLGECLVGFLDRLLELDIVHNDLRCENIMVITNGDGTVSDFMLMDFGCSSFEGGVPWNENTFEGCYLSKAVCGKMRYNEHIVDDAASAMLIYLHAGGTEDDEVAVMLRNRIGRIYFSVK